MQTVLQTVLFLNMSLIVSWTELRSLVARGISGTNAWSRYEVHKGNSVYFFYFLLVTYSRQGVGRLLYHVGTDSATELVVILFLKGFYSCRLCRSG